MKVFAVLLAICIAGSSAAITSNERAKLREYATECIAVTGVSAEIVENAKAGVFPVKDEKLDCFALCFLKKIGLVTAAGEFDEAVLRAKIPADYPKTEVDKIVAQCKPLSGANACETGGKLFKCYLENKTVSILN